MCFSAGQMQYPVVNLHIAVIHSLFAAIRCKIFLSTFGFIWDLPAFQMSIQVSLSPQFHVFSLHADTRVPPGNGKSWNLGRPFSRPGKSWKIAKVVESHGK